MGCLDLELQCDISAEIVWTPSVFLCLESTHIHSIPFSSQLQLSPASYYKIIVKWSLNSRLVIHVFLFPPVPFSITLPTPH